jgi:hypothetical protein
LGATGVGAIGAIGVGATGDGVGRAGILRHGSLAYCLPLGGGAKNLGSLQLQPSEQSESLNFIHSPSFEL